MIFKAFLVIAAVVATQAAGILAPVGVGQVAYGSPYGSPYGGHYGVPAWNPYSTYPAQPAVATQSANIIRSPYNLGQISTYTKAIDTPFSSVRKADVRVSNPGLAVAPAYASPFLTHGVVPHAPYVSHAPVLSAAPLVSHVGVAPVAKVATAGGLLGVAYSAAPAVSHMTYTNGLGLSYAW